MKTYDQVEAQRRFNEAVERRSDADFAAFMTLQELHRLLGNKGLRKALLEVTDRDEAHAIINEGVYGFPTIEQIILDRAKAEHELLEAAKSL